MQMYFIVLLTLLFTSCQKDELNTDSPYKLQENRIHLLDLDNESHDVLTLIMEGVDLEMKQSNRISNRQSSNLSANGHFTTNGGTTVSFIAMKNNGGLHGQAEFNGNLDLHLITECIHVNENEAVYGGQITQITNNGGNPIVAVGNYMYFKIVDHGQGANADPDRYSNAIAIFPFSFCSIISTDYIIPPEVSDPLPPLTWDELGLPGVVEQGDQIHVH